VHLRRAVSAAYYAMFHSLCEISADAFMGTPSKDRCERAWRQTYRAINHGLAKTACSKCVDAKYSFPTEITDFATLFVTMQEMRHKADYDPFERFTKVQTISLIASAKQAIGDLQSAGPRHRAAFAAMLLFKERKP
jgi:uncharacterized protein (UPF0332 family)